MRHVLRCEWRSQSSHFVEHAAGTPDVAFSIVGHVAPHFGAGVVGRACLGLQHGSFGHFGHVEVAKFDLGGLALRAVHDEEVGAFDVAVHNVVVVQRFEALEELDEVGPELLLCKIPFIFLESFNFLKNVTPSAELHDETEGHRHIVKK